MRRTSWIFLIAALLMLAATLGFYLQSASTPAPPLTGAVVQKLIDEGKDAVNRRDAQGVMNLMAPDAKVIGRPLDRVGQLISQAFKQMDGPLGIRTSKPELRMENGVQTASFELDIGEENDKMTAVYFPALRARVRFARVHVSHWLGLYSTEEWRISVFDCDPPFDLSLP